MIEREAVTSALAGPLVNARATSAAEAPCAPTPGREQGPLGHEARLGDRRGYVAPDDRPHARQAALADESRPTRDEPGDVLPERPAVGGGDVLDVGGAGVRRADETEDARAVAAAGAEERLDGVAAEVGVDGQRVGERRVAVARLEEGGRVRPGGRADVAALPSAITSRPASRAYAQTSSSRSEALAPSA